MPLVEDLLDLFRAAFMGGHGPFIYLTYFNFLKHILADFKLILLIFIYFKLILLIEKKFAQVFSRMYNALQMSNLFIISVIQK